MKVALPIVVGILVLIIGIGAAYGAIRTRPEPAAQGVTNNTGTTSVPVVATTTTEPPSQAPAANSTYGTAKVLAIGQTARFADGFTLTPTSVVEDSRCAIDVVCIQAGTVRVAVTATANGKTYQEVITLAKNTAVAGRSVNLSVAAPSRRSDQSITANDYRFTFTVTQGTATAAKCYVGGCSGQICSDQQNVASTCEYRSAYACYKTATCERQANGQCGWTQTATLTSCLAANQ